MAVLFRAKAPDSCVKFWERLRQDRERSTGLPGETPGRLHKKQGLAQAPPYVISGESQFAARCIIATVSVHVNKGPLAALAALAASG